ncbi:TRAP transporter small permease [Pseudomonas sp. GD03721]|nr:MULTISPECIES: TRAP transporter small permease [unclassified Pseudomonas]MDH1443248.1 TRAP transporter small permease [Pseudomonas sp. GD03722]WGG00701.1 TRAP transporter small permease [Pseudomonas sp. GD03721]WGG04867.1 TRAP transporter small permease [Pseudomonas sp. GD03919]
MNESLSFDGSSPAGHGRLYRALYYPAQGFALAGGMLLLLLIGMSLVSIVGRKLLSAPIRGDIELMEIGSAIAIAAFLPLCELRGAHIKVDAFTLSISSSLRRLLDTFAHLACLLVALVLAWRTGLQMFDNLEYGEVSTLLSIPLWIPLLLIVPSLMLLALCAFARVFELYHRPGGRP